MNYNDDLKIGIDIPVWMTVKIQWFADIRVYFGLNVDRCLVVVGVDICEYDSVLKHTGVNVGLDVGIIVGIDVEIYVMLTYMLD